MDDSEVGRMWDENAPEWIELSRAGCDLYRDLVNTPAFLALLPDITGAVGLDVGCGEGHNTRLLAQRSGRMIGLDISRRFLVAASEPASARSNVRYISASGHRLPFPAVSFDFVCAFMSLMDMPSPTAVLEEISRVLRPGGFVQFSISHPCSNTPVRRWLQDETGSRVALANGNYFNEEPYNDIWLFGAAPPAMREGRRAFVIPTFRLTVSGWLNAVVGAGLTVEAAAEPFADEDVAARHPDVADTRIAPFFLILRGRKPRRPSLNAPAPSVR